MKIQLPSYRVLNGIAFAVVIGLLGFAGYLQFYHNLAPCPLCVIQRFLMALIGLVFMFGVIYEPRALGKKILNSSIIVFAILGLLVAGRQVWLQHLPEGQVPACGPGLNYIINNLPVTEAIKVMFQGTGECAQVVWRFLGMSIPEWSLLFFVLLAAVAVVQLMRR